MKHPYHEETRTPEEIRLSKKAYRKRKMLSKKNRIKSEKLKGKKEKRLRLKEAKSIKPSSEAAAEANGTTNEAVNAEIDMSGDVNNIADARVESGKENVLKDAAKNTKAAAESAKRFKKKSKKRKRSDIEVTAESENFTTNAEDGDRQDPVSTRTKTTKGRKSNVNPRKSNELDVTPKTCDDVAEDSEGRDSPLDQEEGVSTENDAVRKTATEKLPAQLGQRVETPKRKRLAKERSDPSGQNDMLKSANNEDTQRGDIDNERASGTGCANDSRPDTDADNGDELNADDTNANKVAKVSHSSIFRSKVIERKTKKEIGIKKKKFKKEG